MNISKELQILIDAALEDGKLSDKEKQVLYKRAEKDGLELDEFELYLDSLFHKNVKQKKKYTESFFMKTIYYRPEGYVKEEIQPGALDTFKGALSGGIKKEYQEVYKKEFRLRLWHLLSIITPILITVLLIVNSVNQPSFDEYLSNYDFEKARISASKLHCREEGNSWDGKFSCPRTEALLKIIILESDYLAENLEFDKAISVFSEINGLEKFNELNEKGIVLQTQQELINELASKLVLKAANHPEIVDNSKMNIYLGYIKDDNEVKRLKNTLNLK